MPPYSKQVWADADATKPLSAARMGHIEDGVEAAQSTADSAYALAAAASGGGGTVADASTTVKGIVKLSAIPASGTNPIAVADTDPRNTNARTPTAHTHPQSDITSLVSDLALKAPLASPAFTGNPTAPTPSGGDNDTSLATTAFVASALAAYPALGTRQTSTYTTGSLAQNADTTGTITLATVFAILKISTTRPARVRLYSTSAKQAADRSRGATADPSGDHGLILEAITDSTTLSLDVAPGVIGASMEGTPVSTIPITVQNLDSATGTVGTTLTWQG